MASSLVNTVCRSATFIYSFTFYYYILYLFLYHNNNLDYNNNNNITSTTTIHTQTHNRAIINTRTIDDLDYSFKGFARVKAIHQ